MADQTMLARRQIRLAALAALTGPAFAGVTIESPGDWDTPPEALPAILLRAARDRKESISKGMPEFTTTVSIEILIRVGAVDPSMAQDALEALGYAIEVALMTNYELIRMVNQVAACDTQPEFSSDGKIHFGGAQMTVDFELPEMFDPILQSPVQPVAVALEEVQLHQDMLGTFDPSGTYDNPPFPGAVQPAPRLSGPDGRDEGGLDITLPQ